jgi:hypothetical protein
MNPQIKDMVENPHPIHRRYCSYWDFLLQSYEGGVDYSNSLIANQAQPGNFLDSIVRIFINGQQQNTQTIQGNLFMHPKERVDDYNRRVRMSYYYNFCAPIIDIYGDHLFKQAVNEDWKEIQQTIETVGSDIDRKGSTIQEFRKSVSDMAQLYGHCFVVVDSPDQSKTEDVVTRADQIEKRAFPYLTLYSPQNVINWALDEYGNPYWVLLREVYDGNEDPGEFKKDEERECAYRLWTRDEWFLYNEDYVLKAQGTHELEEVPITCVYDKKSKRQRGFLGISTIADIAFINRDIYNASSELRQILRDQTFSFLAIQGTSDEYAGVELGTGKGLLYPEGRNKPEYVSPPGENATIYFDHIDRQIAKIFQIAKIDAGQGGQAKSTPASGASIDNQSGISKAWSFNQTNSSLSTKSGNMEDAEVRWWTLFAKWEGKKFTGTVQYPNEFSITSLSDDLDEAEQESRLQLGKTFNVEIRKAIQKKKFPRKTDQDLEIMAKEVEALQVDLEKQNKMPINSLVQRYMAARNANTGTTGMNN